MRILHIIGNGFDLNLGLKTSYKDFYRHYLSSHTADAQIQSLKDKIGNPDDNSSWSDLELALGRYASNFGSTSAFDTVFNDLVDNLAEYLEAEQSKFTNTQFNQEAFYRFLVLPELLFDFSDRDELTKYESSLSHSSFQIDIVTLNYTKIIEMIHKEDKSTIRIDLDENNRRLIDSVRIKHIHGYLDDGMVLGVNDISQLENDDFKKNIDVIESFVKPECNRANKHGIDAVFTKWINAADLICIFGSSIGDTDKKWWNLIAKRLLMDCRLLIFTKGEEILPRKKYLDGRRIREMKKYFLDKTELNDSEKQSVQDKIYIKFNGTMFNGLVKTKPWKKENDL